LLISFSTEPGCVPPLPPDAVLLLVFFAITIPLEAPTIFGALASPGQV